MIHGFVSKVARLPLLEAGGAPCRAGLATCRPALAGGKVVQGFSSPGNSGNSEEMKEVGRPHEVKGNEEVEETAAVGMGDRPGSKQGVASGQGRGYHTSAAARWAAAEAGVGDKGWRGTGIDPDVQYVVPKSSGDDDFDTTVTPIPDTPDERAAAHEEEPKGVPVMSGASSGEGRAGQAGNRASGQGSNPTSQRPITGGYHTWAAVKVLAGMGGGSGARRGLRTHVGAVRASAKGGEGGSGDSSGYSSGPPAENAGEAGSSGSTSMSNADKAASMPPNVGKESSPSERAAEEPESEAVGSPDEVMEKRVEDPDVGGIAS